MSYSPVSPSAAVIWVISAEHPIERVSLFLEFTIPNFWLCFKQYSTIFLYFASKMCSGSFSPGSKTKGSGKIGILSFIVLSKYILFY